MCITVVDCKTTNQFSKWLPSYMTFSLQEQKISQMTFEKQTDLGKALQRGNEAAVFNLDVRKVSYSVTSVQSNLSIILHLQLGFHLLKCINHIKK